MLIRIDNNTTCNFACISCSLKHKQKMVHAVEALLASSMSIKKSCDIVHVPRHLKNVDFDHVSLQLLHTQRTHMPQLRNDFWIVYVIICVWQLV